MSLLVKRDFLNDVHKNLTFEETSCDIDQQILGLFLIVIYVTAADQRPDQLVTLSIHKRCPNGRFVHR